VQLFSPIAGAEFVYVCWCPHAGFYALSLLLPLVGAELSMGWVDPWVVGLGRDFSVFGGLGWVGSTKAKVLKI